MVASPPTLLRAMELITMTSLSFCGRRPLQLPMDVLRPPARERLSGIEAAAQEECRTGAV
jgi:hypothetical protein